MDHSSQNSAVGTPVPQSTHPTGKAAKYYMVCFISDSRMSGHNDASELPFSSRVVINAYRCLEPLL